LTEDLHQLQHKQMGMITVRRWYVSISLIVQNIHGSYRQ
jgi:hypothetical protein